MYREIYEALEKTGRVKTAVILTGPYAGCKCMAEEGSCTWRKPGTDLSGPAALPDLKQLETAILETEETTMLKVDGTEIFVELYLANPHLIILGGGHVSQPTAHLGKLLGFHVTVMDDREDFVSKERFPDADERITGSFEELDRFLPLYENAYYVILTRGHLGDAACVRQILRRPYVYLGMIGSKTKVRLTREKLLKEGFLERQLDTIHAPIGLPLGGQLPEEIAVSIMAEIIQVKNRHYTAYCDEKIQEAVLAGQRGVMMTIVEKSGSSPRGVGSKMLAVPSGKSVGSIGGGSAEFAAMNHCHEVRQTEVREYVLTADGRDSLGMICGGRVSVLFEIV